MILTLGRKNRRVNVPTGREFDIFRAMPGFAAPVWAVPRGTEGVRIMTQAVATSMPIADCLADTGLTEATLADEDAEIWAHQEFRVVSNIVRRLGDRRVWASTSAGSAHWADSACWASPY